jgi:hypothetical protein
MMGRLALATAHPVRLARRRANSASSCS